MVIPSRYSSFTEHLRPGVGGASVPQVGTTAWEFPVASSCRPCSRDRPLAASSDSALPGMDGLLGVAGMIITRDHSRKFPAKHQ